MLGSLTRWLRLLGFDAAYAGSTATDDEVLARAVSEGRFLVTRDLTLVQRCIKRGIPALLLKPGTKEEQLLILLTHSGAPLDPAKFLTRCTECGALLSKVPLGSVADRVPVSVQQVHAEYWECPSCRHIYWQGSHVDEIEAKILDLARKLADA